jgi:hypothetical protein
MKMKLDEFLEELRKIKGWTINSTGTIRRVVLSSGMLQVFCPLTAVYYHKTGIYQDMGSTIRAAIAMDMPEELYNLIADAADWPLPYSTEHREMRRALEEACGLTEPKSMEMKTHENSL